jgi:hypothetical protein
MMLVVPLRRGRWAPLAVLSLAMAMYAIALARPGDHLSLYTLFAWGNASILVAWLLPDAARTLGVTSGPRAPATRCSP